MRKVPYLLAATTGLLFLFNSCKDKSKKDISDNAALGLAKEDPVKISRIPQAEIPFGGSELPASFDMSDKMPEPGNQGGQQSCVAWALAYAMKGYQENVQLGENIKFSPSFVYNQINDGKNIPTYVTDALNVLSDQGVCLMDEMPYDEENWKNQPTEEMKSSAKRFRIDEWRRVNTMDSKEVKTHLAKGVPIFIGATVTDEFRKEGYLENNDYIWKEKGQEIGAHAMLLVGYDDEKNAFKLINSWGKNWGDDGYAWIDYELFPDIVMYGFIAKDGYTAPEVVADIKKGNDIEKNPVDENDDPIYTRHDSPTQEDGQIDFHQRNVVYNVQNPDAEHAGVAMKIEGTLDIPPRYGKEFYVLVTVYNKATGKPVKTKIYPDYSNIYKEVAGYTKAYELDDQQFKAKWWLHIPYGALDLSAGKYDLYAIPTLFIDNFGVKNGEQIDFWFEQP